MAVSVHGYGQSAVKAFNGTTFKVSLHSSSYTPDVDTHKSTSDLTNEVTGTGYTAGGATIANTAVTYDAGSNKLTLDGDDVTWSTATLTARYAVVYSGTDLLCYLDFSEDADPSGVDLKIAWDSAGIYTATVS